MVNESKRKWYVFNLARGFFCTNGTGNITQRKSQNMVIAGIGVNPILRNQVVRGVAIIAAQKNKPKTCRG